MTDSIFKLPETDCPFEVQVQQPCKLERLPTTVRVNMHSSRRFWFVRRLAEALLNVALALGQFDVDSIDTMVD
jgi:hypothetical protein